MNPEFDHNPSAPRLQPVVLRRVLASAIDALLIVIAAYIGWDLLFNALPRSLPGVNGQESNFTLHGDPSTAFLFYLLFVSVPTWAYFILSETGKPGRTLGKSFLSLRVRSIEVQPITLKDSIVRTTIKLAPLQILMFAAMFPNPWWVDARTALLTPHALVAATFCVIAFGAWLLHPRGVAFHDRIAGTTVVLAKQAFRPRIAHA